MNYEIISKHDTEVILVSENTKLWYIENDDETTFFIALGNIVQTIPKILYIRVKSSGLYPVESAQVYRVLNEDGIIDYQFSRL